MPKNPTEPKEAASVGTATVVVASTVATGGESGTCTCASRIRLFERDGRGLEDTKGAMHEVGDPFRSVASVARAFIGHGTPAFTTSRPERGRT